MSEANLLRRLVSWAKISYGWLFLGGRKYVRETLDRAHTKEDVLDLKNRVWLANGRRHPSHWVTKQFVEMCDKEMRLHEVRDKMRGLHCSQSPLSTLPANNAKN